MLQRLKTIHKPDKIYNTAGSPMLVMCNDLENWICKHSRDSSSLVNELIGSSFASIWGLHTPEVALISVDKDHIPQAANALHFSKPCFGSKYIEASKEVDDTTTSLFEDARFRRQLKSKENFLLIALFDIWLSNEDRNHNNSNLLIDFSNQNDMHFTPIDHESIFNSNALHRELYQINAYESLLTTNLATVLFKKGAGLGKVINKIVEKFYICIKLCEAELANILSLIPVEWEVNREHLESQIRKSIFRKRWLIDCENNFRTIIQEHINK